MRRKIRTARVPKMRSAHITGGNVSRSLVPGDVVRSGVVAWERGRTERISDRSGTADRGLVQSLMGTDPNNPTASASASRLRPGRRQPLSSTPARKTLHEAVNLGTYREPTSLREFDGVPLVHRMAIIRALCRVALTRSAIFDTETWRT
jgi:hypothetical protein